MKKTVYEAQDDLREALFNLKDEVFTISVKENVIRILDWTERILRKIKGEMKCQI